MSEVKYKTVLLKLSGEALQGKLEYGIDPEMLNFTVNEIKKLINVNVKIGIVIGGGNIFRGMAGSSQGMDRNAADHMGMLATMINSIALCENLNRNNIETSIFSSVNMDEIALRFSATVVKQHLNQGRVCILGGGTGHPYFTTDTTAALRGLQINADLLIKATKVDGIYDKDPNQFDDAEFLKKVSYKDALDKRLKVMDATAFSLCMENNLPIMVVNMFTPDNIINAVTGQNIGSIVTS